MRFTHRLFSKTCFINDAFDDLLVQIFAKTDTLCR